MMIRAGYHRSNSRQRMAEKKFIFYSFVNKFRLIFSKYFSKLNAVRRRTKPLQQQYTIHSSAMKKSSVAILTAGSFFCAIQATQATTIADWTFESTAPATAGPFSPEVGSGSASGFHSGSTTYSSPAGNGSSHSYSSTDWLVNDYYQFDVSTVGFTGIGVTFDQTSSSTGPATFTLEYSSDGMTFNPFSTYTVLGNGISPNASWNTSTASSAYSFSFDLSSITALNNASTVDFRLLDSATTSANGGTVASGGTDRVDNFVVLSPVPEPSTLALAAGGGIITLLGLRRRK